MSTLYPGALDTSTTLPVEAANTPLSTNHIISHQNIQDALEAVEAKVGVDSSAVTTSHDYKLSLVTTTDKALPRDAAATTTNKILGTGTAITLGSDAEGDTYYRTSGNVLARLPRGSDNQILKMNGNVPNWEAETSTVDASTTVKGIVELATAAEISAGTATGGTGAALVVTPDALASSTPVFNGSGLTGLSKVVVSTAFETAGRFTPTITGGGGQTSNTYNTTGVLMHHGYTYGASSDSVTWELTGKASTLYLGNPVFSTRINMKNNGLTTASSFFGLGNPTVATTGHTYTVGHAGFKIITASGVATLYATQADGVTENVSSALTTLATGDDLDLILKINSTTSIDYYWRKNGGALSSATNLTTNMPSGTSQTAQFSFSTDNTDVASYEFTIKNASYER